jgi:hypothetical protein
MAESMEESAGDADKAECYKKYSKCQLNKHGNCGWKRSRKLRDCINASKCKVGGCNGEFCLNKHDPEPKMPCPAKPEESLWTKCLAKNKKMPPRCVYGKDGKCKWTKGCGKFWLCMKGKINKHENMTESNHTKNETKHEEEHHNNTTSTGSGETGSGIKQDNNVEQGSGQQSAQNSQEIDSAVSQNQNKTQTTGEGGASQQADNSQEVGEEIEQGSHVDQSAGEGGATQVADNSQEVGEEVEQDQSKVQSAGEDGATQEADNSQEVADEIEQGSHVDQSAGEGGATQVADNSQKVADEVKQNQFKDQSAGGEGGAKQVASNDQDVAAGLINQGSNVSQK